MSDVIRLDRVSKSFNVYDRPSDLMREMFTRRTRHDVFWALRDISFRLAPRQRLGIIGPNGSGKTTLLRIISGNLGATSGSLEVNGRISAMLSLNSILNPEETGFENIRFNLLLNGCPKRDVERKIEDIIEFAELGPFIYKPVKTFSSGMNARLSFALTTALEPEILLVDEVLAVGDAYFVGKAMRRMLDVCDRGRALLFVSHSTPDVQRLCDTALWLDQGVIRRYGPARDVVQEYEDDGRRQEDEALRESNAARRAQTEYLSYVDELAAEMFRIRLVPDGGGRFVDTHYVRRVRIAGAQVATVDIVPGHSEPLPSQSWIWLDAIGCEWGRLHEHRSVECRLLYGQTGRRHGGQFLLRRPPGAPEVWPLEIEFESSSDLGHERLTVECLDLNSGDWRAAAPLEQATAADGWHRSRFSLALRAIASDRIPALVQRFRERNKPDVDIVDVEVISGRAPTESIAESVAFDVRVTIEADRLVPLVDVAVKINRVDGVYVFWQSSGMVGQNIENLAGRATITFRFDPNCFGAGHYLISATCHDGWDVDRNYPFKQIFARRHNARELMITRADPRVDMGQINMFVPVTVERCASISA